MNFDEITKKLLAIYAKKAIAKYLVLENGYAFEDPEIDMPNGIHGEISVGDTQFLLENITEFEVEDL